jgi:hypothetical protein
MSKVLRKSFVLINSKIVNRKIQMRMWILSILLATQVIPQFAQDRPELLFREDWKEIPAALPVTQDHVKHPDLILNLYGAGQDSLKKSHHDKPADDPYYIWSGRCRGNWAVALSHREMLMDLSGQAKVKWRSKQFGFRVLRLLVEDENGDWWIADRGTGASNDWLVSEFNIQDLQWRKLNIETVVEEHNFTQKIDLSRIVKIGFTDLMIGGNSQACSRLDWIELYAKPVMHP